MTEHITRKIKILSLGMILPVFLFSVALINPFAPPSQVVSVVFAAQPDDVPSLQEVYDLQNLDKVFEHSTDPDLEDVYKALIAEVRVPAFDLDARTEYVQIDPQVEAADIVPDDPFINRDSSSDDEQWYLQKIKMFDAWQYGIGSTSTIVAIVDTGIHSSHVELDDGRVIAGYNAITNAPINANTDSDDNGHGTAVAGVIGAIPDNAKGIAGINWEVSLMPIKAMNAAGSGALSDVAEGIVWAADHGAHVINLSLGGNGFPASQVLSNAIAHAYNKGVVIVAAAGNDSADVGSNLDTDPVYPVCADNGQNMVIGVAASDYLDRKATFSNFGINCVDIVAPGKRILTTTFLPSEPSDSVLIYGSGTSLAAPVISGVAALLRSNSPNLTNIEIRDIIISSADNINDKNLNNCLNSSCAGFLGKGRINALSALSPKPVLNGALVRQADTNRIYLIDGGLKQYISEYVFIQRGYNPADVVNEYDGQLDNFPNGFPVPPLDGTLIKAPNDPTVYYIHQGLKRALTFLVFTSRGLSFADVRELSDQEVSDLRAGDWYWPPDGTMVLINDDPTVYVMHNNVKRPVTYFVFTQRRLSFANVVEVSADEFTHIPSPDNSYWLAPLDNTLVKSDSNPTVYVIEQGRARGVSAEAFASRNYSFSQITILPSAEMKVIEPGEPILN